MQLGLNTAVNEPLLHLLLVLLSVGWAEFRHTNEETFQADVGADGGHEVADADLLVFGGVVGINLTHVSI